MDTKKFLLATVSGLIVMFLLAYIGHTVLMEAMFESSPMDAIAREMPNIPGIGVAYLVTALLMAYIYPKGVEGSSIAGNGLKFGIVIGLLISLPISIIMYSTLQGGTIAMIAVEGVWHMIEQGAGGLAIAYAYGRPSDPISHGHSH